MWVRKVNAKNVEWESVILRERERGSSCEKGTRELDVAYYLVEKENCLNEILINKSLSCEGQQLFWSVVSSLLGSQLLEQLRRTMKTSMVGKSLLIDQRRSRPDSYFKNLTVPTYQCKSISNIGQNCCQCDPFVSLIWTSNRFTTSTWFSLGSILIAVQCRIS